MGVASGARACTGCGRGEQSQLTRWHGISFEGKPARRTRERRQEIGRRARQRSEATLDPFAVWLLQRAGLDSRAYRPAPLNRRIAACLRALRVDSEPAAVALLTAAPELLPRALDALLIGVTRFARDAAVFDVLRDHVIPALALRREPLRVWSAGCSNGAELLSAAILLDAGGLLQRSYLLGTDCRESAIREARAGDYTEDCLRELTPAARARYFRPGAGCVRPLSELRDSARWARSDVTRTVEEGPWHLILCRNVAIYLTRDAAEDLWRRLAAELAPGGFLVTGKAECQSGELTPLHRCLHQKPWSR